MKLTRCKKCKVRIHPDDMDIHKPECGKKEVHHHHYPDFPVRYINPFYDPYWAQPRWTIGTPATCGSTTVANDTVSAFKALTTECRLSDGVTSRGIG